MPRIDDAATASGLVLPYPYLLFLGDVRDSGYAKTAFGLRDWAPERCLGEYRIDDGTVTTGLPALDFAAAAARGARAAVIGVANSGGVIPDAWIPHLEMALSCGLDLVSGMHIRLEDIPALDAAARRTGRRLINVRCPPAGLPVANGRKRRGKRLLTIGTDCALGKKYTALALDRAFRARGVDSCFRATGQTGIMISGQGIPMDAVVSDFAAGTAELLSPDADDGHWDVIEGQGSLAHPAYAGVSLAILHGSQPDVLVVCHDPCRTHMLGYPGYPVPDLHETIELALQLARRTNPAVRCAGISMNTSKLDAVEAERLMAGQCDQLGLPVADPIRAGASFERLVDSCLA